MANYYVDFKNSTDRTWNMAVYQTIPNSIGLDSVAWKLSTVPQSGFSGVTWEENYNVAIADYRQDAPLGVYYSSQAMNTNLGYEWNIVYKDGVQQLELVQALPLEQKEQIIINNISGLEANPGIGMAGMGSVYKRNVLSNASAQFIVTPTYWVGLFRDVQRGEVISSNVEVGPLKLTFAEGSNVATIEAARLGDSIEYAVGYSRR
ncbi:hypothetical protein [Pseudodesulfovibrio sediminis]|uniref:Uncharacterized protein n=1 Tax=Pseudodesulfovibrio sediminis TaxID=2810563 RepID=A0ABM7P7P2_9BACT|nr:hypothetical protein [Pseudodesulfovibrio sediminis]BCS89408.1 hypothetical protein PSDVSF_26500 [Pseudodesulfovibrio sediminis]